MVFKKAKRVKTSKTAEEAGAGADADEDVADAPPEQADDGAAPEAKKRKKQQKPVENVQEEDDDDEDEIDEDDEIFEEEDEEEIEDNFQEDAEEEDDDGEAEDVKRVWRPGIDALEEGEQLDCEPGTYDLLHRAQVEWPCLSFDVVRDDLGAQRTTYPMTAYIVAGTQAEQAADNRLYMMKWSKLYRTNKDGKDDDDDESESEDSDDDDEDHEAVLESKAVEHPGGVNRIRAMHQAGHIVATWADTGKVHMWNLQSQRKALDKPNEKAPTKAKPIFTFDGHKEEGFAMDFSPHDTGRFLSGGNDGSVMLWEPAPGGWKVNTDAAFLCGGASASTCVEDVQWKRHGSGAQALFASCGTDMAFRVWDVRESNRSKPAVHVAKAHTADVNVLSWSPLVGELLVTGSDDGGFKIWDTRNTSAGAMANFKWHKKPITSVDWHPTDETVLSVSSADDTLSIWDMAVEDDAEGRERPPGAEHYPAQLLFLHMGQRDPKELRWHPQLPSVCICTAASGFNIFKTCNV